MMGNVHLQAVAGDSRRRDSNDIRHTITCILHARSGRAIVPDTKIDDHAHCGLNWFALNVNCDCSTHVAALHRSFLHIFNPFKHRKNSV